MRKQQIFNAILEIISEKGVSHLTTTEIAKKIGISQPAIYKHFKNKDELILYFIKHLKEELEKIIEKANEGADFFEKLEKLYKAHFEFVSNTKVIPRFPFSDEIHGEKNVEKREEFKDVCFKYYLQEIEKIFLHNGIKKIDEKICANILMGSFLSVSLKWMLSGMEYPLEKEIPDLIKFWKDYFMQ